MKKLILLISMIWSVQSSALVGFGHMTKFAGSWTNNQDGSQESYFDLWPYLSVHELFPIWGDVLFQPEFGMTLKKSSYGDDETYNGSGDEASKRQLMFLHLNFMYRNSSPVQFKGGVGFFMTKISGEGGAVTRRNGASDATYYLPSESVTSYNNTLNLGIESFLFPKTSFELETYVWDILASESRRFSFSIGLNYYL
ncbi:MAG: hypothetical protein EP326_10450 [Deltaproteobacteria bacterium]|nr:MAG: hypothetical protein EP326_10450 [Deltaproteobacteria bacterium]TNF26323.1 MAG: hypothetical protein EP319_14175 [Deltaproteobacteria bacterium]